MLLSGSREERQSQLADLLAGYEDFAEFDRANCSWSRRCARCGSSTTRHGSRALGRSGISGGLSMVRHAALLGTEDPGTARTGRGDAGTGAGGLTRVGVQDRAGGSDRPWRRAAPGASGDAWIGSSPRRASPAPARRAVAAAFCASPASAAQPRAGCRRSWRRPIAAWRKPSRPISPAPPGPRTQRRSSPRRRSMLRSVLCRCSRIASEASALRRCSSRSSRCRCCLACSL